MKLLFFSLCFLPLYLQAQTLTSSEQAKSAYIAENGETVIPVNENTPVNPTDSLVKVILKPGQLVSTESYNILVIKNEITPFIKPEEK